MEIFKGVLRISNGDYVCGNSEGDSEWGYRTEILNGDVE